MRSAREGSAEENMRRPQHSRECSELAVPERISCPLHAGHANSKDDSSKSGSNDPQRSKSGNMGQYLNNRRSEEGEGIKRSAF